jgi:hypothetical protein
MRRSAHVLLAATFGACGPSLGGDGDGTASSGPSTDTSGATSAGMADDTASASDTTGAAIQCDAFADETASSGPVIVEIRNVGGQAVLLNDPCSFREYIRLSTSDDVSWPGGFCQQTCETEFGSGCVDCGACAEASYVLVFPGGTLSFEWPGVLFERVAPPAECFEFGPCAPSCLQARTPVRDVVAVEVQAIRVDDCLDSEPEPDVACTCEPGPEGWCETYGSALIDPTVLATGEYVTGSPGPIVIEISG